jgi:hypothetical protein
MVLSADPAHGVIVQTKTLRGVFASPYQPQKDAAVSSCVLERATLVTDY